MISAKLSAIYIYPVKSLCGIQVNQWDVTAKGLRFDRKWMVIDAQNKFLTQRQLPRMELIKTSLDEDQLTLIAPTMESISLPLYPPVGTKVETNIWQDTCAAYLMDKEINQWLSEFLRTDCRLVYQAKETKRPVDKNFAAEGDIVRFSDGFPFLIISQNSLHSLNNEMDFALPMSRFRPNLVISGCDSYAEDYWRTIEIGAITFRLPKPCSRCAITTIDPVTASFNKEPLKTLNRIRKWNKRVYFGQNALHNSVGTLAVGDSLAVINSGPAQPPI